MSSYSVDVKPILTSHDAKLDIVFVHGLNGNLQESWGFDTSPNWAQWLSGKHPINIYSLGYRVSPSNWTSGSMAITDRATNVLATLDGLLSDNSIIFVCHSYGGLLVKEMLRAARTTWVTYQPFADRIRGIVFLGTPHTGSGLATYFSLLPRILARQSPAANELQHDSARLRDLNAWFRTQSGGDLEIIVFCEALETGPAIVVDAGSADPGWPGIPAIAIDADHFEIAKPKSVQDVRVTQVRKLIDKVLAIRSRRSGQISSREAAFLRTCFDRPAFSTRFADEVFYEDFEQAIQDTITALKTGTLMDRKRGTVLMTGTAAAKLSGELALDVTQLAAALETLLKIYRASIQRNKAGKKGMRIFENNGHFYKPDRDVAAETAIDRGRSVILDRLNQVLERHGMQPLPIAF